MKNILSNLTAEHTIENTFKPSIDSNPIEVEKYIKAIEINLSVTHPVIRKHPHTKEKYLYINGNFTTKDQ